MQYSRLMTEDLLSLTCLQLELYLGCLVSLSDQLARKVI